MHFTARWNCKCDCGKEKEVDASNLRGGYTKSCGCLNNETRASRFRLRPYENAYNRLCYNAKNRNILVELTYEEYLEFTKILNCHYCDNELIWTKWANKDSKPRTNLDRKDNNIGYTKENCLPCCPDCNQSKSDIFCYELWVEIGKTIKQYRERSK